jgi:hypothetical protein
LGLEEFLIFQLFRVQILPPQIEKNPNPTDVMEFFLAKKGREKNRSKIGPQVVNLLGIG